MEEVNSLINVLSTLASTKGELDSIQISWEKFKTEYASESNGGYSSIPNSSKGSTEHLKPIIYIKYK